MVAASKEETILKASTNLLRDDKAPKAVKVAKAARDHRVVVVARARAAGAKALKAARTDAAVRPNSESVMTKAASCQRMKATRSSSRAALARAAPVVAKVVAKAAREARAARVVRADPLATAVVLRRDACPATTKAASCPRTKARRRGRSRVVSNRVAARAAPVVVRAVAKAARAVRAVRVARVVRVVALRRVVCPATTKAASCRRMKARRTRRSRVVSKAAANARAAKAANGVKAVKAVREARAVDSAEATD